MGVFLWARYRCRERPTAMALRTCTRNPGPESGLDCLICAEFDRKRRERPSEEEERAAVLPFIERGSTTLHRKGSERHDYPLEAVLPFRERGASGSTTLHRKG